MTVKLRNFFGHSTRYQSLLFNFIARRISWRQLQSCGVTVHSGFGDVALSVRIGGVEITPEQTGQYLPSLEKWSASLAAGNFRVSADRGTSRLLLQRGDGKIVALPPVSTLCDFLGGVIKHWNSIEVDSLNNVRSIAGVTVEGNEARVSYRGVGIEYVVEANWMEESLEEVFFWGDLLPNYYYRVGHPPRSGIVFDLGAYHGLFGLAAAVDVGPCGRVFCFEPDAKSRVVLEANRQRNRSTNVEVVPAGVSGRTEKQSFVSLGRLGSHLSEEVGTTQDEVQVYSLPDCCKVLAIDAPAFVKADVEGSEIEMVESALTWIKKLPSTVFSIASYHIVCGVTTKVRLEQLFQTCNYRVATTREGHQTTVAWRA